jgi:hypothetical protein
LNESRELNEIDSFLENSEADVEVLDNSHRVHSGCDLSTEDAYSS